MKTESGELPNPESNGVLAHLNILQTIISRMANNSAMTKTWCVTLVAAITVLVARTSAPAFSLIGLLPVTLFCFIDAYYLANERAFRRSYEDFVGRLHDGELRPQELYLIKRPDSTRKEQLSALGSWSVLPFYGTTAMAVVLVFALALICS